MAASINLRRRSRIPLCTLCVAPVAFNYLVGDNGKVNSYINSQLPFMAKNILSLPREPARFIYLAFR